MVSYLYQPVTGVSRTAVKTWDRMWLLLRQTAMAVLACVWLSPSIASFAADPLDEARAAYQQQQYEQALKLLDPVIGSGIGPPGALELRLRTYLKLGQTDKAVEDYLHWTDRLGTDDVGLLRELTIQVIGASIGDMREQMRGAAVTALKEMGGAEALPLLEKASADQSGLVRALAVEGMARHGQADRSKRLRELLHDPAALVRVAVLRALGESGNRGLIPEIEPLLRDEQPRVKAAAGAALVALGRSEALPGVLELVKHPKPDERAAVLSILGHLKDSRVAPALFSALSDREAAVRATAAGILAERKEAGAAAALTLLLKDPVPLVRGVAATGLTKLQGAKAVPLVEPLLQETVPAVRAEVAAALLPLSPASADPVLRESMNSPDPGVRSAVAKHLGQAGNKAVPYLLDLLHDQTPRPRISAVRALGHVGTIKHVALLRPILGDLDVAVRVTAAGAIGRLLNKGI